MAGFVGFQQTGVQIAATAEAISRGRQPFVKEELPPISGGSGIDKKELMKILADGIGPIGEALFQPSSGGSGIDYREVQGILQNKTNSQDITPLPFDDPKKSLSNRIRMTGGI